MKDILLATELHALTQALQLTYGERTCVDIKDGMLLLRFTIAADDTLLYRDISKLHNYSISDISVSIATNQVTINTLISDPQHILPTAYLISESIKDIYREDPSDYRPPYNYIQSYADTPEMLVYKNLLKHWGLLDRYISANIGYGSTIQYSHGDVRAHAILRHNQNFKVCISDHTVSMLIEYPIPSIKLVEGGLQIYNPAFSNIVLWPAEEMFKLIHDHENDSDFGKICLDALITFYRDAVMG